MRKCCLLIGIFQFIILGNINAQWTPVNTGLSGFTPTSMYGWPGLDVVWLGTLGGGIFKTIDNGNNWTAINGDLANLNVNDIRPFGTGTSMFVATEGGPFHTMDESSYANCTTPGLTNTDINLFWYGNDDPSTYFIGSNGGGAFLAPDYYGPWIAQNNGVSGDGLIVNDMGGYSDDNVEYAVMATDDGVYFADSSLNPWTRKVNGLSGDALKVKKLTGLGSAVFIATHGGLFLSMDLGDNWTPLIPNEKLNTAGILPPSVSPIGLAVFAFGAKGYYSLDITNYNQIDMTGIIGEVTCFTLTTTDILIGVNDSAKGGSIYRQPINVIVDTNNEELGMAKEYSLEQNYPNPFNPSTVINYSIPKAGKVELSVYNLLGQKLVELVNAEMRAGNHSVSFDGSKLSSGTYFYKMIVNGFQTTKKMVFVK